MKSESHGETELTGCRNTFGGIISCDYGDGEIPWSAVCKLGAPNSHCMAPVQVHWPKNSGAEPVQVWKPQEPEHQNPRIGVGDALAKEESRSILLCFSSHSIPQWVGQCHNSWSEWPRLPSYPVWTLLSSGSSFQAAPEIMFISSWALVQQNWHIKLIIHRCLLPPTPFLSTFQPKPPCHERAGPGNDCYAFIMNRSKGHHTSY